jgi:hypothetical protein
MHTIFLHKSQHNLFENVRRENSEMKQLNLKSIEMKRKIFTLLACSFLLFVNIAAFSQSIEKGCFYIQASGYYRYLSIIQTYDGNYIIGGLETGFAGGQNQNLWVFKIDAAANLLWSSSIGTTGNDGCYGMIETSDHKIVAAGFAGSSGDQDFFIIKYDEDGTILWKKNVDHGTGQAYFTSITEAPDGAYVLAGVNFNNAFLYKIDADGNKVWSTEINDGGIYSAIAQSVVTSTNGGYMVSGWGIIPGAFFTHVNEDGEVQWSVSYDAGSGYDVIPLADGGYLIGGYETGTGQPHPNAFVTKIDSNGDKAWSKTYGGDGAETFYSLYPTSDGGFIGAGVADTGAFIGTDGERGFVVKCNSDGEPQWSKRVNSATLLQDAIQTSDGGYALLGNGSIIKLDADGNGCDECLLEDFGTWMEVGDVASKTMLNYAAEDSIFDSPYTAVTGGTAHELCTATGTGEILTADLFSVTPNPANQQIIFSGPFANEMNILIKIFDATGRVVFESAFEDLQSGKLDVSSWQNGIYFSQLKHGNERYALKFMVQH